MCRAPGAFDRQVDQLAQAQLGIPRGCRPPAVVPTVQVRQEQAQHGRLNLVQPRVEPDLLEGALVAGAVKPQQPHAFGQVGVRGGNGAAVAQRRQILGGEERERRDISDRPGRPALVGGAERLRRVLDQRQAVAVGQLAERRQVDRLAEQVHDHDRSSAIGDRRLDGVRVEVERVGSDVDEHRDCADPGDGLSRREERVRRGDHLVAGAHPNRFQCQQQRVGAVGDAHRVGGAELRRHLLLEPAHLRAEDKATGVDHVVDRRLDLRQQARRTDRGCP